MGKISALCFLVAVAISSVIISPFQHSSANAIYQHIQDIYHPTLQDYYLIQDYLTHGKREGLELLEDTERLQRTMKIIGTEPHEIPQSGVISVNSSLEERENCLVLYASFNLHYPEGLKRLIELVKHSDFVGHIIYHIGGWPDLEGGSLTLAHVPFAFKICCIKEAQRLGYKRVLWLDTSIVPRVSLNSIFERIEKKGYFTVGNYHSVGQYCNAQAAAYFNFTPQETARIQSVQAGFLGVNFTHENGKNIVDSLYRAAQDKHAFYSARSDQNALSLILRQLNLSDFPDMGRGNQLFFTDRAFVQH